MCRIAREPNLKEWTSRAELCDMLLEPVGPSKFQFTYLATVAMFCLRFMYLNHELQVRIAIVGKYTGLSDSYLSLLKVRLSIITFLKLRIIVSAGSFTCSCDEVFCESLSLRLLLLFLTCLDYLSLAFRFPQVSFCYFKSLFNNTSQTFNLADHI